jgi:predicted small lipoprotein YifL
VSRCALAIGLVCCLLVTLAACGNKGPLLPAEDEKPKKSETLVVE